MALNCRNGSRHFFFSKQGKKKKKIKRREPESNLGHLGHERVSEVHSEVQAIPVINLYSIV